MMLRKILYPVIIVASVFIWSACDTSRSVEPGFKNHFIRYYGNDGAQRGVDLLVNHVDKSIVLLGSTSFQGNNSIYLVKTDWEGNLLWEKVLGGPRDLPKDIEQTNDGGFIILSETLGEEGSLDIKLLKVSHEGEKVDSVVYGSPLINGVYANEFPATVTTLLDGGFVVTGSTEYSQNWGSPSNTDSRDIFHYRFNADLSPYGALWGDEYGNASDFDAGVKTIQLRDERFYVLGYTLLSLDGVSQNDFNFWFYPKGNDNASGNIGYIGNDEGGNNEVLKAVCPAFNGGYFLVGEYNYNSSGSQIFVSNLNESNGELFKSSSSKAISNSGKRITPVSVAQSVVDAPGYLILGNEVSDTGTKNIWLSKLDDSPSTEPLWSSSFGALGRNDDEAGAVAELPDGRIVVVGTVNLEVQNFKMVLIKLNRSGQLAD